MLELHGIASVSLHGKLSQKQRAEILDGFRTAGPGQPRVMLMSGVGAVGLNMSFASILIIAVSEFAFHPCICDLSIRSC